MAVASPIQIRFERFNGDIGIAPAKPPSPSAITSTPSVSMVHIAALAETT